MKGRQRPVVVIQPKKSKNKTKQKNKQVTLLGHALRQLGGLGGGMAGGLIGQGDIGSRVGTSLGAAISRWLGSGDYTVKQNSVVSSTLRGSSSVPMMHTAGQSITVRHKEFLCSIKGSVDFKLQRFFLLQPGDSNTFPWLNGIATRFQQYRIKGLVFHYVPTSGYAVSGTNPALGAVMIQTSYRANDTDPTSKLEMLNEYWATESIPSDGFCHPIECSPAENPFQVHYVRTKPVPLNDSPLLYDIGKTYIATQGMPDNDKIVGDLWVTYEIELIKPQIESNVLGGVLSAFATSSAIPQTATPLGPDVVTGVGTVPFTMVNRTISFPLGLVGKFLITATIQAATVFTNFDWSGAPTFTNSVAAQVDLSGLNYTRTVVTGTSANVGRGYYQTAVNITDPSSVATVTIATVNYSGTATPTQVSVAELQ